MGFEPTRAEPIGLAVQRLNHSATSSHWYLCRELGRETNFTSPSNFDFIGVVDLKQHLGARCDYPKLAPPPPPVTPSLIKLALRQLKKFPTPGVEPGPAG